jgi:hypothetical protein
MLLLDDVRFLPMNLTAGCGDVAQRCIHGLFGCGYAALGLARE